MSSKWVNWKTSEATECIDGITTGRLSTGGTSICHTQQHKAPWLALQFFEPVNVARVDIYNRDDFDAVTGVPYRSNLRNVEVRLTDELPASKNQRYTGGELLGAFDAGPGGRGEIIKVEGTPRIGRYVLIQMNRDAPLVLNEVKAFGQDNSLLDTDCNETLQLYESSGNMTSSDEEVQNLFLRDEREWKADEGATKDQGFVLKIKEANASNVSGIIIQNAPQPWASRHFRVSGSPEKDGPWTTLVEEELEESTALQTFYFGKTQVVQFLKFELVSYAAQRGGGLRFFSHILGEVS